MYQVLVTGGCGFIGSHLCDRLLLRSDLDRLVVVDNLWTGLRDNLAHVRDPRFLIVEEDVERFQTEEQFHEIYHLASPASPCWYMADPGRTISANVVGAMNVLKYLAPKGRFCFTSTSEVYGDAEISPQPEQYRGSVDCTGPRASYDEGKRCTEALLFETRRTKGLDLRVVRLFNVYGPRTRADDGRAVSNFIAQALAGKSLTVYGDGLQARSWGYIDDIMDALERFFWRDPVSYPGPLNLGNRRQSTVLDLAHFVSRLVGGVHPQHMPPSPQDPMDRCPDLTLANQILPGWECRVPYEEGVRRTFEWFTRNTRQPEQIVRPGTAVGFEADRPGL